MDDSDIKSRKAKVLKFGGINFYSYESKHARRPVILVPGGPWISGRYLDGLAKSIVMISDVSVYRAVLPNHEIDFGMAYKHINFSDIVDLMISAIDEISFNHNCRPVLIGHSFGSIILANALLRKKNDLGHLILISSPLSLSVWPKFNDKLKSRNLSLGLDITDDVSFAKWWREVVPLYFYANKATAAVMAELVGVTYVADNNYQTAGVPDLYATYKAVSEILLKDGFEVILIEGQIDPIGSLNNLEDLKMFFGEKVHIVPKSGHFPMLENEVVTTKHIECFVSQLIE